MENENMLKARFDLEMSLLRTSREKKAADAALRQAKFDLREAKQAQTLYGSTFKSFCDKLRGKREAQETKLRHAVQRAEASLTAAKQTASAIEDETIHLYQSLASFPKWEDMRIADNEATWCRLEALYCAEVLLPLLDVSHALLIERRNQANGANSGEIKSHHELAEIYSAPEKAGEACKPYLQRLQAALTAPGMQLPVCTYFENPSYFLNSATKYTRMDQLNKVISQTETLRRKIAALQKELDTDDV